MGIITREIENKSRYFEGEPEEDWELLTIVPELKNNVYYYRDREGGYHHRTVKRKDTYNPFVTHVREENGVTWARVVNKKTGQQIRR